MTRRGISRPTALIAALAAALLALAPAAGSASPARSHGSHGGGTGSHAKPTIVLVHGAFADSSGWDAVAARLIERGYPVLAFPNPLRGPVTDGEYLRQFLDTVSGPVVLVGHSYGGAVITNAATGDPDVEALVYVAAYAPAEGESVAAANELGGGHTVVTDHLVLRPYPGAPAGDADAYIDPAWFHQLFAQDLPRDTARVMAASQRPGALGALLTPSGAPAWADIPSWYVVAKQDRIIPPEAERAMARRAGALTIEVKSSHVVMVTEPGTVTKVILDAARD
ncbi:alpha/beta hydrolase [Xylanimonas allomyrinae]|uniref:Alpha/beta hydrolase n=1 Tax=Xylanimonas allomyrinae TaxID=2509459 RepID=A0A4P6EJA2_9MICO|nr:alpha/beta hydrolase [Xylanimonas allomyrinae]QAY62405.1 alpha/beta hydrolase [Xylanimonas allomyrinae]